MRAKDLCEMATDAGMGLFGKIVYNNDYPDNVMRWHSDGNYWTCDCLGFVHTLINGCSFDKTILGGGAVMDEFVLCTTEIDTINRYCHNVSYDFEDILPGEILYMKGHVGLYVGDLEPFHDGRVFNVAECCYSSFGGGGMLTYVDEDGTRMNHRNGATAGRWEKHGQCDRVEYEEPAPDEDVKILLPQEILGIVNDTFVGKYGCNPQRERVITAKYGAKVYRQVQDILNLLYI